MLERQRLLFVQPFLIGYMRCEVSFEIEFRIISWSLPSCSVFFLLSWVSVGLFRCLVGQLCATFMIGLLVSCGHRVQLHSGRGLHTAHDVILCAHHVHIPWQYACVSCCCVQKCRVQIAPLCINAHACCFAHSPLLFVSFPSVHRLFHAVLLPTGDFNDLATVSVIRVLGVDKREGVLNDCTKAFR